jgi:hypothetical protein
VVSASKVQTRGWRCITTILMACFAAEFSASVLHASSLILQFRATISQVQGDPALLNLPFTLAVGQPFTGKYSYADAQDLVDEFLRPARGTPGHLVLNIAGSPVDFTTNVATLNDGGVIDINEPPPGPSSSVFLGYRSLTDVYPGTGPRMWIVGPEGTIANEQQILDISRWNQLTTNRRLDFEFGYPYTVSVQSTIGEFVVVPEPSTCCLGWLCVTCGLFSSFSARQKRS